MTFLPIVERELRVSARKRSTFWLRVVFAITGLVIGSACMIMSGMRAFGTARMGDVLFYGVTWPCMAAALCAGLFFTSDTLSEEKREGTLGFLFLTDLRGYDVVLGKLLATSLRGFYALLALLPILAISLLIGGITGAQFWKTSLALINALVCSLAAGLLVSAISRDSQKALGGTLFLLILWTAGGPLADGIIAFVKHRGSKPLWCLSSPGYAFVTAGAWGRSPYWWGLFISQGIAWLMFALASILAPRTWQERTAKPISVTKSWSYAWKYGGPKRRARIRRKLLDRHPIVWLACRERWQSLAIWAMAVLVAAGFIVVLTAQSAGVGGARNLPMEVWMAWSYVGGFFTLLLYLWTASQACGFFVEARRSGLTELLLAAPLTERQVVQGHWRALLRMFMVPALLLLSVHVVGSALSQNAYRRIVTQANTTIAANLATNSNKSVVVYSTSSTTNALVSSSVSTTNAAVSTFSVSTGSKAEWFLTTVLAALFAAVATAGNLIALCWFGMWMGMTSRTANLATLKALLFVQIVPWLVIAFGSSMLIMAVMMPYFMRSATGPAIGMSWMAWYPLLSAGLAASFSLAKDIGFIVWSRKKLYYCFREQAAQTPGQAKLAATPVLPPMAAPPVIALQP